MHVPQRSLYSFPMSVSYQCTGFSIVSVLLTFWVDSVAFQLLLCIVKCAGTESRLRAAHGVERLLKRQFLPV